MKLDDCGDIVPDAHPACPWCCNHIPIFCGHTYNPSAPEPSSHLVLLQAGATARKRADGVMPSGLESGLKAVAGVHHNVSGM